MKEQTKFTYSPLGKSVEKQTIVEDQGRKQVDGITNQSKRLTVLTNTNNHKGNYKEVFEELVKERFGEIKKLNDDRNHNDLIYHFKGNIVAKDFIISIMV